MGKSWGFTFLLVYLFLAIFVGLIVMASELALGRKTRKAPIAAYKAVSSKYRWLGWFAVLSPFLIMTFYSVLGGYCIYYIIINLIGIFGGMPDSSSFGAMITSIPASIGVLLLFMVICFVIVAGGISGGIEKFNKIGMPALFVMLLIIIVRSLTLPNAVEGLKFMFIPGYAVKGGFIEEAPNLITVLGTAGGQMFFSLSLAMGAMITYGSYLGKDENLVKNSGIIVFADTLVALLAGIAVIPAAVANGINNGIDVGSIKLNGPGLLFSTLQDVFHNMGAVGGIFGVIFYLLVLIAAISSAISLMEVLSAHFIDKAAEEGKTVSRKKVVLIVSAVITVIAILVAADGLGSNGFAPADILGATVKGWNDCWLDFFDCWSEGIMMPLGAMLMALMIGGEIGPKVMLDEIHNGEHSPFFSKFYRFCVTYVVPAVMCLVLAGQLTDFFGNQIVSYIIAAVCYIIFTYHTLIPDWRKLD
jgi:NSS family neurotransmitter:Na+ symporter